MTEQERVWRKTFTVDCDGPDCRTQRQVTTTTDGPDHGAAREQLLAVLRAAGWSIGWMELCPRCVTKRDAARATGRVVPDHPADNHPAEGDPPTADHPAADPPTEGHPPAEV